MYCVESALVEKDLLFAPFELNRPVVLSDEGHMLYLLLFVDED
jgi:hypothetical protein